MRRNHRRTSTEHRRLSTQAPTPSGSPPFSPSSNQHQTAQILHIQAQSATAATEVWPPPAASTQRVMQQHGTGGSVRSRRGTTSLAPKHLASARARARQRWQDGGKRTGAGGVKSQHVHVIFSLLYWQSIVSERILANREARQQKTRR